MFHIIQTDTDETVEIGRTALSKDAHLKYKFQSELRQTTS
jgi:hypothetical protein